MSTGRGSSTERTTSMGRRAPMYGITAFLTAMVWTASAVAQANTTPNQTDATTGGILYGVGALVAAAVIGAVVYMFIKRNRGRTY